MAGKIQLPVNIEDTTVLKRFLTNLILNFNTNPLITGTTSEQQQAINSFSSGGKSFNEILASVNEIQTKIKTYVEDNIETVIKQNSKDIAVIAEQFGTFAENALAASWYGLSVKAGGTVAGLEVGSLDPDVTTPGDESSYFRISADNFLVGRAYEDLSQEEKDYLTANNLPNFGTVYNANGQPEPAFLINWDSINQTYNIYFNGKVTFNALPYTVTNYVGEFANETDLNNYLGTQTDFTLMAGDTYKNTTNNIVYTWDGNVWVSTQGPQGPQGTQGLQGTQGIPGTNGTDGQTTYLHIKYSDDGTTFTGNSGETVGDWIGTYVDFILNDSNTFSDYTWKEIKGTRGSVIAQVSSAGSFDATTATNSIYALVNPDTLVKGDQVVWTDTRASVGGTEIYQWTGTAWSVSTAFLINGNAIVDGTLVADDMVTGTLDASQVNVTNINASNISAGELVADRIKLDGTYLAKNSGDSSTTIINNSITRAYAGNTDINSLNNTTIVTIITGITTTDTSKLVVTVGGEVNVTGGQSQGFSGKATVYLSSGEIVGTAIGGIENEVKVFAMTNGFNRSAGTVDILVKFEGLSGTYGKCSCTAVVADR